MTEQLKTDEEFRTIIPPLTEDEYANLERSLREEGCRDAILVWNGVIVDGHNRYEICRKWSIPFPVAEISFESREAAVSWICLNQLSRRNLSREAYKYLIGKRYDAEKAARNKRNSTGRNQYSPGGHQIMGPAEKLIAKRTSRMLAREYNLTHTTVERYGEYSRSLDRIEKEKPGMLSSLLSGKYRLSQQRLSALSRLPGKEIETVLKNIESAKNSSRPVTPKTAGSDREPERRAAPSPKACRLNTGIKEMPEYNPDAEMNGLAFTIPTWIGMLERMSGIPVRYASGDAKEKMRCALTDLQKAITSLQAEMEQEA